MIDSWSEGGVRHGAWIFSSKHSMVMGLQSTFGDLSTNYLYQKYPWPMFARDLGPATLFSRCLGFMSNLSSRFSSGPYGSCHVVSRLFWTGVDFKMTFQVSLSEKGKLFIEGYWPWKEKTAIDIFFRAINSLFSAKMQVLARNFDKTIFLGF